MNANGCRSMDYGRWFIHSKLNSFLIKAEDRVVFRLAGIGDPSSFPLADGFRC